MTCRPTVLVASLAICFLAHSEVSAGGPAKRPHTGPRLSAMGEFFRDLDAHPERLAARRERVLQPGRGRRLRFRLLA